MIDLANVESFHSIEEQCIESNHTRLPVCDGDLDKVVGILHFRDYFTLKSCNENPTIDDVRERMRDVGTKQTTQG